MPRKRQICYHNAEQLISEYFIHPLLKPTIKTVSANRRQYRQAQRDYEKHARVIDWNKIKAQLKTAGKILPLFAAGLFITVFIINYFGVRDRNNEINAVMASPATSTAIITEIHKSKNSSYAIFQFSVANKTYKGQLNQTNGKHTGDEICVMYNTQQPNKNIYCYDSNLENFKDDVLMASLKLSLYVTGGIIVLLPLLFLFNIIKGDKQTIAAVTSKKHR